MAYWFASVVRNHLPMKFEQLDENWGRDKQAALAAGRIAGS